MISYFSLACICIAYVLFDVNYFLRILFTIGYGRLFQAKKKIFEKTSIYGIYLIDFSRPSSLWLRFFFAFFFNLDRERVEKYRNHFFF
uniref:Uncharacterized protein n=1 Tax=Trichogramma kaykai TaxID=54128 RepID=A0ABD2XUK7_9HYME